MERQNQKRWGHPLLTLRYIVILLVALITGAALFYTDLPATQLGHSSAAAPRVSNTVIINGADRWIGDSQATKPTFDLSAPETSTVSVSPLFASYYSTHNGATSLGAAVTPAFPTEQGWMQFFHTGALFLPAAQREHVYDSGFDNDPLTGLIAGGLRDSDTGIISLPLLQALLTMGSQLPIGGDGSPVNYVDLRTATDPDLMVSNPSGGNSATLSASGNQEVFVSGGTRDGKNIGHLIPQAIWNYINKPDVSPDGWERDFGTPLTEALAFTVTKNGSTHYMQVQAFWRDAVEVDEDTVNAFEQPQVRRLDTGIAYLRTAGPPPVEISSPQTVWSQGDTALLNAPGSGQPVAHIGQNFPLTLQGSTWSSGTLWYQAQWTVPKRTGSGWLPATAITFTSPGDVTAQASFDILSPGLAAYLASIGSNMNAVVYDVTRQRYYTYSPNARFIMGSSMKVPIMLTFLDMTERQGRQPTDDEMNLLTTMIENSDNDSASALYYGEIGGAEGVAGYLHRIGITGLEPDPDAWGFSLVSPLTMVNILTLLYEGKILTAQDRNLAFYLMEHIESDQQVGVGDTAPQGATAAMKDGWLPGPDGYWVMNSSGIVSLGNETYIISVYTDGQNSLADGQAIVEHFCSAVASLLT
ncbi:MAG TPA: serine hydrolase [Ktedonobacteraceae bacterium]